MRIALLRAALITVLAGIACGCMSGDNIVKPQPDRASEINLELGIQHFKKGNLAEAKDRIDLPG